MKKVIVTLSAVAAIAATMPAGAVLLSYDDFSTVAPTNLASTLATATNGYGWLENWFVQGDYNYGYRITNDALLAMSYVDGSAKVLLTNGMFGAGGDAWTSAGRRLNVSETWQPPTVYTPYTKVGPGGSSYVGAEGSNLWFSALVRQQASNNDYELQLTPQGISWVPDGNPRIEIGLSGGTWQLQCADTNGTVSTTSTGIARALNTTYLMVLHVMFGDGNDVVDLFVNPASIGGDAPVTPSASVTLTHDLYFRSFRFYPGSGANNGYVDEVRIGETYADVTPAVPEPAFALALASLALVFRRK